MVVDWVILCSGEEEEGGMYGFYFEIVGEDLFVDVGGEGISDYDLPFSDETGFDALFEVL